MVKCFIYVCLVSLFYISSFAGDDNGSRCVHCGKRTLIGGNHICIPRRIIPYTKGWISQKNERLEEMLFFNKICTFELKSIKYPNVKYNNYFSFDKVEREWTSRKTGRVLKGIWRTCSECCNTIYIENQDTDSFVKIDIEFLIEKDQKYVNDRIEEMKRRQYKWWQGGFFSFSDINNIRKAERAVLENSILRKTFFKVLRVVGNGVFASFCDEYNGKIFYIPEEANTLVSNVKKMTEAFFWASTYLYVDENNQHQSIDQYTLSFPRAVYLVRAKMKWYDETSWDYPLFEGKSPK